MILNLMGREVEVEVGGEGAVGAIVEMIMMGIIKSRTFIMNEVIIKIEVVVVDIIVIVGKGIKILEEETGVEVELIMTGVIIVIGKIIINMIAMIKATRKVKIINLETKIVITSV